MRKLSADIRSSIAAPIMGLAVVTLFTVCFLLAMAAVVCVTRVLLG